MKIRKIIAGLFHAVSSITELVAHAIAPDVVHVRDTVRFDGGVWVVADMAGDIAYIAQGKQRRMVDVKLLEVI